MKSLSKNMVFIFLCSLLALTFFLSTAAFAKPIVVNLGHEEPPGSKSDLDMHFFADMVRIKSEGRLEVKVYPASQLGKGRQMLQSVVAGSQDMVICVSPVVGLVKEDRVWDLPFLFKDRDAVTKLVNSPLRKQMEANYIKKNIILIGYFELGFRHLTNNTRPVYTPDDLTGIKVRTPSGPTKILIWKSFGASPASVAYAESYQALKTGVVDGMDSTLAGYYFMKFYEVQKYLSVTAQVYNPWIMVFSKTRWDKLPKWAQSVLQEAGRESGTVARYKGIQLDIDLTKKLEAEGLKINTISDEARKLFRKAGQPVYDEYEKIVGKEYLQKIYDIVGE